MTTDPSEGYAVTADPSEVHAVVADPPDGYSVMAKPADRPYRGVAKVVKPPGVRAFASVPGALSVPRQPSRRWPRLASRSITFPRRVRPAHKAPQPAEIPPLRAAVPGASDPVLLVAADGAPGVRERGVGGLDAPGVQDKAAGGGGAPGVPEMGRDEAENGVREKRKHRLLLPALAGVVAAIIAGGGYLAATDRPTTDQDDLGRWAVAPPSASDPTRPSGDPFATVAAAAAGPPTRVRISAIDLDTTLETLRIGRDGALQPPKSFSRAGWYADGTAPGDTGPAVIAGHVDSKFGPAIFYRLRELTVGDRIDVTRGGTIVRFTVTGTAWYPKTEFPASQVYGPTPDRQLRLITCGGVFDHSLRSYKDNLVVYAVSG